MTARRPFRIDAINPKTRTLEFYAAGHLRNFRAHKVDVFVKNGYGDWLSVVGTKIYTNIVYVGTTGLHCRILTIHSPQYQQLIPLLEAAKLIDSAEAGKELARFANHFREQQVEIERKALKSLADKFGISFSQAQLRKLAKK